MGLAREFHRAGTTRREIILATLKDLSVSFLSLVARPATGKSLTLKSAKPGERVGTFEIIKTDDDRMMAYGIVYAPDEVDSHGDTADAQTIRRAAHEFMREGRLRNVDTEHSFTAEMAYVAESWIVRTGDELFGDEPVGAWAVGIQIGDPDLWKRLKAGELTGISLAGVARVDPAPNDHRYTEKVEAPGWFARWLKSLKPVEEKNMDENKVREIVRAEVGASVKDALKSVFAPDDPPTPADPAQAAVRATQEAVEKAMAAFESKLDDKIAKAVAKGATEADQARPDDLQESFA